MVDLNFWRGRRVLVTGHTGFIGGWLSLWLHDLGSETFGYSLPPPTEPSFHNAVGLANLVRGTEGDIRDAARFANFVQSVSPDIVLHLAAQALVRRAFADPVETYTTNLTGLVNVLEAVRAARSVRNVVVVTSDKVYENIESDAVFCEGDRLGGQEPYGTSKAAGELIVDAYRHSYFASAAVGIATVRAGNVIGGGDWAAERLVPDAVRSLATGKKLILRNPASVRPWQHVVDAAHGILLVAEALERNPANGAGPWNIGPDPSDIWPVSRVVERFMTLWGDGAGWETMSGVQSQPYEARLLRLDSLRAQVQLGWRPSMNLDLALSATVEWYRAHAAGRDVAELSRNLIRKVSASGARSQP